MGNMQSKFIKPYSCLNYALEGYDLKESDSRVQEIKEMFSWGNAISCLAYYMKWKQDLAKRFHLIFPELTKDEKGKKAEEDKIKKGPSMSEMWGMEHQLQLMTERDLDKIDSYKSKPLSKVLRHLSYCIQDNDSRK